MYLFIFIYLSRLWDWFELFSITIYWDVLHIHNFFLVKNIKVHKSNLYSKDSLRVQNCLKFILFGIVTIYS